MKNKGRKNYLLIGLIVFVFIFGWISVSAMSNRYNKHTPCNEENCIDKHYYVDGKHIHNFKNIDETEETTTGTGRIHYGKTPCNEENCIDKYYYVDGKHIHNFENCNIVNQDTTTNKTVTNTTVKHKNCDITNCTNTNHNHGNGGHHNGKGHN
jgi:hypothetical protein